MPVPLLPVPLLPAEEVERLVVETCAGLDVDGRHVVVLVPDATRTAPMPLMAGLIDRELAPRAARLSFLVALGTHQPMSPQALHAHLGELRGEVVNHAWDDPAALTSVGTISGDEVAQISGGLLRREVDVRVNRLVVDADLVLVCGPVFPHEVVGFSGGNKYFFPGVSGQEVIDATHWLGALITSGEIIGTRGLTPVRRLIDRAAQLVPTERHCLAMVVSPSWNDLVSPSWNDQVSPSWNDLVSPSWNDQVSPSSNDLVGLYAGTPEHAWEQAAALSSEVHVRWLDHPYRTVLSVMPAQYEDIWTAAKGMYKVEPVVADGGEVIIYAPHIREVSVTHGEHLREIGYHVRDYFLGQWDRFEDVPGSLLAHSTHLRGAGTWTAAGGEQPRVAVTLATGIDAETCAAYGLGHRDPATIDVGAWQRRAETDDSLLVVPKAGELLHRLRGR